MSRNAEHSKDLRFDPGWLKARAIADDRSRNKALAASLHSYFAIRADMSILDLGCGVGSNLPGLYQLLPTYQRWTLVEHDRDLLDMARDNVSKWADRAKQKSRRDDILVLEKDDYRIEVTFRSADMTKHLDQLLDLWPDLVVATALIDLMPKSVIEHFAGKLAARRIPFYATHTADGEVEWYPENKTDPLITQAIGKNAMRDRGFGPSLGPRATSTMAEILREQGAMVEVGPSAWELNGVDDRELLIWIADHIASIAADTRLVPETVAASWAQSRAMAETAILGHEDLFATF